MLANTFKELGIIEKYGTGIKRIHDMCSAYEIKAPEIDISEQGFKITLFKEKVGEKVGEKLSDNQKRIIEMMIDRPDISAKIISTSLNISTRKTEENIRKLREKGHIQRIGPAKGGHWEVL